jgi:multidrug efflux pump subunit AcrA (membrane-fusion protein)
MYYQSGTTFLKKREYSRMITIVATVKEQQENAMIPHTETITSVPGNTALQALLDGRSGLAETRLAVTAAQIIERLRIRASNLQQLMKEELSVDSRIARLQNALPAGRSDMMNLESVLEQKISQLRGEQRRENTECWKDLTLVIRDLLNAWEGFFRNEAKNRFLSALPTHTAGTAKTPPAVTPYTFQNDPYHQSNNNR